jgi:hypothetical protein
MFHGNPIYYGMNTSLMVAAPACVSLEIAAVAARTINLPRKQ